MIGLYFVSKPKLTIVTFYIKYELIGIDKCMLFNTFIVKNIF